MLLLSFWCWVSWSQITKSMASKVAIFYLERLDSPQNSRLSSGWSPRSVKFLWKPILSPWKHVLLCWRLGKQLLKIHLCLNQFLLVLDDIRHVQLDLALLLLQEAPERFDLIPKALLGLAAEDTTLSYVTQGAKNDNREHEKEFYSHAYKHCVCTRVKCAFLVCHAYMSVGAIKSLCYIIWRWIVTW